MLKLRYPLHLRGDIRAGDRSLLLANGITHPLDKEHLGTRRAKTHEKDARSTGDDKYPAYDG